MLDVQENQSNQKSQANASPAVPSGTVRVTRKEVTNLPWTILEGKLPVELHGSVFLMGPVGNVSSPQNQTIFPGGAGASLFNGDGMVYRVDFKEDHPPQTTCRLVKTPCYYADLASTSGSRFANFGFLNAGLARLSMILGFRNELNTAFLPIKFANDPTWRLLVTWDAGRPYEIDPVSLALITPIGRNDEWREQQVPLRDGPFLFKLALTGAHPAFDNQTQQLFMVNWGKSILTLLSPSLLHSIGVLLENYPLLKLLLRPLIGIISFVIKLWNIIAHRLGHRNNRDFVDLICWEGEGDFKKWRVIHPNGLPVTIRETMHQIGVTQDYVVLMDTAFKMGPEQVMPDLLPGRQIVAATVRKLFDTALPPNTAIYVIRRSDLKDGQKTVIAKRGTIPREIAHFLTDYDSPCGMITLHVAHNSAWDPAEWLHTIDTQATGTLGKTPHPIRHLLTGMVAGTTDLNSVGRHQVNGETGALMDSSLASDPESTWATAIYAANNLVQPSQYDSMYWVSWGCWDDILTDFIFNLYKNYKYRTIKPEEMLKITQSGKPSTLCRFDIHTLTIAESYQFPEGWFANSPQFLPKGAVNTGGSDGYLLCVVLRPDNLVNSASPHQSELWVFDAAKLGQGPVCKLAEVSGELTIGLTIHTTWLPAIAYSRGNYNIPPRQDYDPLIEQQPDNLRDEIQEMFEQEIYPHFEK